MLSAEKSEMLQAFLGTLPEHLAARLAKAVEVDRLSDGNLLPHDLILEGLRPALKRSETHGRTLTPLRLFCRPFEDLLSSAPRTIKQKGRIARSSVTPIWLWVSGTLMPPAAQNFTAEIKSLLIADRSDESNALAREFWARAAQAICGALATEAGRKVARTALNGELAVADAAEAALLLEVGGDIVELQELLPKPVLSFTEQLVREARTFYDRIIAKAPDAAPYVAVIAMNRLARRWEALRLPLLISRRTQDTLISATDMGLVGEILFSDIDALSQAIRNARHPDFDAERLVENVAGFAELSSAVVKEIEVRRDGKWGQTLLKDRAGVGAIMDAFMERAPREIAAALPTLKSGSFGAIRVPDFARAPDPEKIARALRYARLIAGCRPFAAAASFAVSLKDAHDEADEHVRRYSEDVVKELRNASSPHRDVVQDQFGLVTELTALLFGDMEADLLRRRGRAALAAAT